jgi:hypothetical protein
MGIQTITSDLSSLIKEIVLVILGSWAQYENRTRTTRTTSESSTVELIEPGGFMTSRQLIQQQKVILIVLQ